MNLDENIKAYQDNKLREQHCFNWLKKLQGLVKKRICYTVALGVLLGVLIIAQSALIAVLVERIVFEHQLLDQLVNLVLYLVLIFIARSFISYFLQTLGFEIAADIKSNVRKQLLQQFYSLGPNYVKQHEIGALSATTLEYTDALDGYFSRYLPQKQIVSILPIIMIVIVMPVNWVVGCIFLITGPLIPVFMALVGMGAASAQSHHFLSMSRMNGYFLDRLQGLTTLKLFGQAEAEVGRIKTVANQFREKTMAVLRIAFLSSAVLEFFSAVAIALVAVYVGLGLLGLINFGPAGDITLSEALFVLLLAPEFFNPLKKLAVYYHDKAAAIAAAHYILSVLEHTDQQENSDKQVQTGQADTCIEFKNINKSYQQKRVFNSCNLKIRQGEKIALIGSTGSGKTTFFNLLLGFEEADSGQIYVDGLKLEQITNKQKMAWTSQKPMIFYASIEDNISLKNPHLSHQQIVLAAMAAGVTEFSAKLKNGLKTLVGEKGYGLSGGQAHRIALARAFVKDSPIILLDEPGAHLDHHSKLKILAAFDEFFYDKTVIVASHDPHIIQHMDRVVDLNDMAECSA